MDLETVLVPREQAISTEFDGDGVIVDLDTKKYYQLNETAMFIWQRLEKGQTLGQIIAAMTDTYDVSSKHATESIERVLLELRSRKLIQE